ncbi:3-oxoadipate enol-lactonase [Telmatospirillum sp. J64-1]|uniref:3-oxoadipate enol-lactonase n=1 Tax=Telmatospirillum sp. J64-1 TaxID=2502183 RepID=UPI001C8F8BE7|nr:3-oxoadipate enol-lactonase [Telmatospirillum sp. J64-1]
MTIRYREDGNPGGRAMVFANSLGTDMQVWEAVLPAFTDTFRVIRYDERGHGLSDAPPAPYSLQDHVLDIAAVMEAAGAKDSIVVGLSVGGMIAQGLAIERPDLVAALVLCDTAHKIGTPEMWEQRIGLIRKGGIAALAEPILERWFSASFRETKAVELGLWRNMLTRTPLEGYLGTCCSIRDADLTDRVGAIRVPTLCLCGTEDGATPPELVRSMADLIPGAGFMLIPEAGHLPCVENPAAFVSAVTRFLEENDLV